LLAGINSLYNQAVLQKPVFVNTCMARVVWSACVW
jgi:hypothetical protein